MNIPGTKTTAYIFKSPKIDPQTGKRLKWFHARLCTYCFCMRAFGLHLVVRWTKPTRLKFIIPKNHLKDDV